MRRLWLCLLLTACPKDGPDPKAQAEGLYLAGTSAYLKGDFTEAHQKFAEVRSLNPADPRLPAAEGEVYLAEVKLDQALLAFQEASKLDGKRATTFSRIGYIQLLKGNRAEATAALDKALVLNPRDFNALEARSEIQLKEGKVDEAIAGYLAAAEAAPELAKGGLVLQAVTELTARGRGDEGLKILEAQAKKGLKSPEVLGELGDRLVAASRLSEARDAYTAAAKLNPRDPTLWELVGELDARLDKPADAEAAFRESLKVKDRGVVHVALARLCQARKDEACLREEVDKALATASGEELRELVDLADLLASVGRKKDAFAMLREIADEQEQKGNPSLQLKVAQLAKEAGDKDAVKTYCANAAAASDGGALKCP
ncbi:MAG: tetratricopeptide repeat protein [Archangiaceae bacterium]|nr:tetratricopeptide repeat protein [Archangiaceae bacterium]